MIPLHPTGLHYLAGPYRGAVRANIRRAEEWSAACARRGIYYICPHMNSAFMGDCAAEDFWLTMDEHIVVKCECVLLMPGWETSHGTQDEKALADRLAIPVWLIEDYLEAWDVQAQTIAPA